MNHLKVRTYYSLFKASNAAPNKTESSRALLNLIIGKLLLGKSKFFLIVIGVLVSVVFYYINYFAILFGKNETLPVELSVWLPQILIFLICTLGLTRLNEN